ncbi:hypothetical protein B0J14DRAFT_583093 [Halenospora varia]|nr:hypothetical protein B0J14DRAFT_583093 [Halenospora varia]
MLLQDSVIKNHDSLDKSMGKRPKKKPNSEYYAVIRGFYLNVPTIFSSWGDAHPLVTRFKSPKPPFKGFVTLVEAEAYMVEEKVENYEYKIKDDAGETTPHKGQTAYYAVANGRNPGIQTYYYGEGGAEPEVVKFSGACHKHFRTLQQAKNFIADWEEMHACVVKAKIKRELSGGHRPEKMQGTPVPLSLKTECNTGDEELADSMRRMTIENLAIV